MPSTHVGQPDSSRLMWKRTRGENEERSRRISTPMQTFENTYLQYRDVVQRFDSVHRPPGSWRGVDGRCVSGTPSPLAVDRYGDATLVAFQSSQKPGGRLLAPGGTGAEALDCGAGGDRTATSDRDPGTIRRHNFETAASNLHHSEICPRNVLNRDRRSPGLERTSGERAPAICPLTDSKAALRRGRPAKIRAGEKQQWCNPRQSTRRFPVLPITNYASLLSRALFLFLRLIRIPVIRGKGMTFQRVGGRKSPIGATHSRPPAVHS